MSDREANALLNLVSYNLRENSVPADLTLSPEVMDLATRELPSVNFALAQTVLLLHY